MHETASELTVQSARERERVLQPPAPEAVAAPAGLPEPALVFGLAAVALLVYANSLHSGFALDDGSIIVDNARVHHVLQLRDIWLTPYWPQFGKELGLYRPMAIFLYALQWAAGSGQAWVFHAVNLLLHALVTVLVYLLLKQFATSLPAVVGALLFAVHPVHTEAVANVVGQAELVTAAAILGACILHATRPPGVAVGWGRRLGLLALFTVAVFTKENAVVLPALLVLVDLTQRRIELSGRGVARYARAVAVPFLLLAAALAAYALLRFGALEGKFLGVDSGPQLAYLKEHRVLNALRAFPEFMRLLFYPVQLSADYHPAVVLPVESLTPMAALGLVLLAAIALLALATPWRPGIGFPAAWFLISIIIVSNLLFPIGVLIAERTLYLPSVAVAALATFVWPALAARVSRRWLLAGVAMVSLALGLRTWTRNPDWASTSAVLTSVVRDRPESYRAQWAIGATELAAGDVARAFLHYEAAYRIYPRDSEFLDEYGNFLLSHGDAPRAQELLEAAYRMHPYVLRSASLLAYAYLANDRFRNGLAMVRRIEELGGPPAASMPLRAYAYERLGLPGRAAAAWRVAIRQPGMDISRNWSFLARALALAGHQVQADSAIEHALARATDTTTAARTRALAAAIRSGCYRDPARFRPAAVAGDSASPPRARTCDPLGDWLKTSAPQSAIRLQNARLRPEKGVGSRSAQTR